MDAVCESTNEKKYRVNKLLARLIDRFHRHAASE